MRCARMMKVTPIPLPLQNTVIRNHTEVTFICGF